MTPMEDRAEEIARGLSAPMREALDRLARRMVWIDGRSRKALVRRKLARVHGEIKADALLGTFKIVSLTPLGLAVRTILTREQP